MYQGQPKVSPPMLMPSSSFVNSQARDQSPLIVRNNQARRTTRQPDPQGRRDVSGGRRAHPHLVIGHSSLNAMAII
jgi:hypothetical protein